MNRIALLVVYFGEFPEWAPLYFETLRRNPGIDFIFYTDTDGRPYMADNIRFKKIDYDAYLTNVRTTLNIDFRPVSPYKLCDLRPFYGKLHRADFAGYDFYGWTDMDILFGDIRRFYTEEILNNYDVISAHEVRISGHLAIFRNTFFNRNKYRDIYNWKLFLEKPEFIGLDEHGITNAYTMTAIDKLNEKYGLHLDHWISRRMKQRKRRRLYLKEQYTTPFSVIPWTDGTVSSRQPDTWYYTAGKITNSRDKDRNFIYLHLMNFKSSLWRHDGTKAPWEGKQHICSATPGDMDKGIRIDPTGIHPL